MKPEKTIELRDYKPKRHSLGSGSFGSVYKLKHCNDETKDLAVKAFFPNEKHSEQDMLDEFTLERKNFKKIGNHPHIVKVRFVFKENEEMYYKNVVGDVDFLKHEYDSEIHKIATVQVYKIALEHCPCGDLSKIFEHPEGKSYTEKSVQTILHQCVLALQHMLDQGFLHRDLKASNILVRSYDPVNVCICDLNLSINVKKAVHRAGTELYKAPETSIKHFRTVRNKKGKRIVDSKSDIWSLGICIFELLSGGAKPFLISPEMFNSIFEVKDDGAGTVKRLERARLREAFLKEEPRFRPPEHWMKISREAKELMTRFLKFFAVDRPTYQQILQSKWMKMDLSNNHTPIFDPALRERKRFFCDDFSAFLTS